MSNNSSDQRERDLGIVHKSKKNSKKKIQNLFKEVKQAKMVGDGGGNDHGIDLIAGCSLNVRK